MGYVDHSHAKAATARAHRHRRQHRRSHDDEADVEAHVSLATLRVPGYSADDIKLEAHEGRLSVELSRNGEKSADYWLLLPKELKDPSNLVAVCQDGILSIKHSKNALRQLVERSVEVSATRVESSVENVANDN